MSGPGYPAPVTARLPLTPIGVARAAWRTLRTMRTAIILLLLVAAAASVGSIFPQRPIDPRVVLEWKARNPGSARFAEFLGLFDVYGAWWFMTLYGLLLVSLVGCLVPRYRAFLRVMRARPRTTVALETQQRYTSGTVALEPAIVSEAAEGILRARRYRIARDGDTLAAEKGRWREGGSLVFHSSILVLLVGVALGKLFGFTAQTAVIEGERFTDTHVDYDAITEGKLFNERHLGFTIAVDDFEADWHANGIPKHFISRVRVLEGEREVRRADIRVNHPLSYRGRKIHQLSWGWAPQITVKQAGRVLYDGPTVFLSREDAWHGVVKIPQASPQQVGFDLFFYPDPGIAPNGLPRNESQVPRNPLVIAQLFQGDLRMNVAQSVYDLDKRDLVAVGSPSLVRLGETVTTGNGITVTFAGLKEYTVFQIGSNPGAPILLAAALMLLVGLIPALYSSRRRVWVRVTPSGEGARLEIAGHALQRKAAFEDEFQAFVRDLDRDLHSRRGTVRESVGARDG